MCSDPIREYDHIDIVHIISGLVDLPNEATWVELFGRHEFIERLLKIREFAKEVWGRWDDRTMPQKEKN